MEQSRAPTPFDKDLAEALCGLEIPRRIRISPNGQNVVYATAYQNRMAKGKRTSTLWLASMTEAGSARKLTSGKTNDNSAAWHPDGKQIAFLSNRGGSGDAIWLMRLDGGDAVQISDDGIGSFAFSPDGETIAYTSPDGPDSAKKAKIGAFGKVSLPNVHAEISDYHAKLRLLNVKTGEKTTLDTGKDHVMDFSWKPDGSGMAYATCSSIEEEQVFLDGVGICTIDVKSGAIKELATAKPWAQNLKWAADGKIYFTGSAGGASIMAGNAVFSIDPAASPTTPVQVASGDEDDADSLMIANGQLLMARNVRAGCMFCDVQGKTILERPVKVPAWDAYFDAEKSKWIMAVALSDVNTPAEVVVCTDGEPDVILSEHGKTLKDRRFGNFHVLTCPSSDGAVELDGILFTPASSNIQNGVPEKPLPTAVLIHGGPPDRDYNGFDSLCKYWTPYLLAQGYAVLLPQYRGSTGRGGKFAMWTDHGHGKENYDDIITLTDNAVRNGFADSKRLLVGGWSMGGLLTYLCAVRNGFHGHGWRFNAAIAGAAICDMDSLALTCDIGAVLLASMSEGGLPWTADKAATDTRRGSALWEVSHAVAEARRTGEMVIPPMLILHGEQDTRAPFSQAQGFRRAMRTHDLPGEFVSYPGEGHTISEIAYCVDMLERVSRWCDTYIGPGVVEEKA